MPQQPVDLAALGAALDRRREMEGISWRQLAQQLDLSPSTLSRLRNLNAPDTTTLLALTGWLGMRVEDFLETDSSETRREPDLMTQLAPLLRARADLDESDAELLVEIVQVAYRRMQTTKGK